MKRFKTPYCPNNYLIKSRGPKHWICVKKYYSDILALLLDDPDPAIAHHTRPEIITRPGNTMAKLLIDGQYLMIKRNKICAFWKLIKNSFYKNRAQKNWHYGWLLQQLNIPTPEPIAAVQHCYGPIKTNSYYIYRYVDGLTIGKFFEEVIDPVRIHNIAEQIAKIFKNLFSNKLYHNDSNENNFIIEIENDLVYLIDIEATRAPLCWWLPLSRQEENIRQFLMCWKNKPELFAIFKEVFLATGLPVPEGKRLCE